MSQKTKSSERLLQRLIAMDTGLTSTATFCRYYPGHWQRSDGAWVWEFSESGLSIGSQDTVKSILKAKKIELTLCFGQYRVDITSP